MDISIVSPNLAQGSSPFLNELRVIKTDRSAKLSRAMEALRLAKRTSLHFGISASGASLAEAVDPPGSTTLEYEMTPGHVRLQSLVSGAVFTFTWRDIFTAALFLDDDEQVHTNTAVAVEVLAFDHPAYLQQILAQGVPIDDEYVALPSIAAAAAERAIQRKGILETGPSTVPAGQCGAKIHFIDMGRSNRDVAFGILSLDETALDRAIQAARLLFARLAPQRQGRP